MGGGGPGLGGGGLGVAIIAPWDSQGQKLKARTPDSVAQVQISTLPLLCERGLVTLPLCASVSLPVKWERGTLVLFEQLGSVSSAHLCPLFQNGSPS